MICADVKLRTAMLSLPTIAECLLHRKFLFVLGYPSQLLPMLCCTLGSQLHARITATLTRSPDCRNQACGLCSHEAMVLA